MAEPVLQTAVAVALLTLRDFDIDRIEQHDAASAAKEELFEVVGLILREVLRRREDHDLDVVRDRRGERDAGPHPLSETRPQRIAQGREVGRPLERGDERDHGRSDAQTRLDVRDDPVLQLVTQFGQRREDGGLALPHRQDERHEAPALSVLVTLDRAERELGDVRLLGEGPPGLVGHVHPRHLESSARRVGHLIEQRLDVASRVLERGRDAVPEHLHPNRVLNLREHTATSVGERETLLLRQVDPQVRTCGGDIDEDEHDEQEEPAQQAQRTNLDRLRAFHD